MLAFGEAGIGKTALLRQFYSEMPRRFTTLWGTCDPLFTPRPLGPLLEPAAELGGDSERLVSGEARPFDVALAFADEYEVDNPGAILDCRTRAGRAIARRPGVAMTRPAPVIGDRWWWKGRVGYAGTSTEMTLRLPRGMWGISLQYDSVAPVTVRARGLNAALPANLEPLGPYWYVGSLAVRHARRIAFVLRYRRLPLPGRLLGSSGQTRAPTPTGLIPRGRLTATRLPVRDRPVALHDACGRYVDFYRLGATALSTGRGGASR